MKTRARPVPWLPCDEAALAKAALIRLERRTEIGF